MSSSHDFFEESMNVVSVTDNHRNCIGVRKEGLRVIDEALEDYEEALRVVDKVVEDEGDGAAPSMVSINGSSTVDAEVLGIGCMNDSSIVSAPSSTHKQDEPFLSSEATTTTMEDDVTAPPLSSNVAEFVIPKLHLGSSVTRNLAARRDQGEEELEVPLCFLESGVLVDNSHANSYFVSNSPPHVLSDLPKAFLDQCKLVRSKRPEMDVNLNH